MTETGDYLTYPGSSYNISSNYTHTYEYEVDFYEHVRWRFKQPHRIVALILGFFSVFLNILSILAIRKARNKLSSHYRFIVSLALSDILVGLTVTGHIVNLVLNPRGHVRVGTWEERILSHCMYIIIKALNTTSLNMTLLNLMAMAIDHFLAILRPLHYPSMMNERRATMMIVLFWLIAAICGFSDMLSVYPFHSRHLGRYNFCELVAETPYQEEYPMFFIAIVCFGTMTFTYILMFLAIKQRHNTVGPVQNERRNKKALFTTLFILGTFVLCWLPQCLFQISLIIAVSVDRDSVQSIVLALYKADKYLFDLLLLNTILDPLIYAIRMKEVQFGYRRLFATCRKPFDKERRYSTTDASHSTVLLDERSRTCNIPMNSLHLSERQSNGRQPLVPPSVHVHVCD